MQYSFNMPVRVIGGEHAVLNNMQELSVYGKRAFIVCGKGSAEKSGALRDVTEALENCGIEFEIFNGITQNPKTFDCHKAGEKARNFGANFIIGIGGGSQLDAAKAVAVYTSDETLAPEDIYSFKGAGNIPPVVLVGTTAGTGSEVTAVSVLTRESGRKKSVSGNPYFAKLVFADPKYTYSVPFDFTASTAVDAFSHAVESLFSKKADINSLMFAKTAIPVLWEEIKKLSETGQVPNREGRDRLYYASLTAGMALNLTGTCFPHTLGYTLTEQFNVPHGFACAAFLPDFIKRAEEFSPDRATEFYSLINNSFDDIKNVLLSLKSYEDIHFSEEQIRDYCGGWSGVKNFDNTPGGFTKEDAEKLLRKFV